MKTFGLILSLISIELTLFDANSLPFCPKRCICSERVTNCSQSDLQTVPTIAAESLIYDLRYNQISQLNASPFRHLSLLTQLFLSDNRIERLTNHLFAGMARLRQLHLENNRIEEIDKNSFKNLHELQELYIHNNFIQVISKEVFSDLPSLKKLYLQNNRLTQLSSDIFTNNKRLLEIRLENNHFVCNCNLLWMKTLSSRVTKLKAFCNSVIDGTNHSIQVLTSDLLGCSDHRSEEFRGINVSIDHRMSGSVGSEHLDTKRLSDKTPDEFEEIVKRIGTHLELKCNHFGQTFWRKNGNIIETSLETKRIQFLNNGSLVIKKLLSNDSGIYRCVGPSEKSIQSYKLIVSEPPVFKETPDSVVEVESGATLRLECLAKGVPEPDVEWTRNSRNTFRVINNLLIIENIKPSDEDVYECKASNREGMAFKEIKIRVKGGELGSDSVEYEDNEIIESIKEAREIVELAIDSTLRQINDPQYRAQTPTKLMRIARFPLSPESIEFAKSIEIYEKSLEIIRRKAESKSKLPFTEYKYQNLLSPNQLNILSHLSGCLAGHYSQNIDLRSECRTKCVHQTYRSYTGICNNINHELWGASLTAFIRLIGPQYEDGLHLPIGWFPERMYNGFPKPNPRKVSQQLIRAKRVSGDPKHSHMLMQFGQFLDHDIDFSMPSISFNAFEREPLDCSKTCRRIHPCFSIDIPIDDIRRNATNHSNQYDCIELIRSSASCGSGLTSIATGTLMAREQVNQLTSFIDASNVYGSTVVLANHLREKSPNGQMGRMRTSIFHGRHYLPLNEARFPNDCQQDPRRSDFGCFLAGDIRANEQLGLLSMHTLWLREHNRIAEVLRRINPNWSGEQVYQESRKIVGSQLQFITYYHWLPHILGSQAMSKMGEYQGYNESVNPSVANVFATAALRFGHTMISPFLLRLDNDYNPLSNYSSHLILHKSFFAPHRLVEEGGIDPLLRGLLFAPAKSQRSDQILNSELTENLFLLARDVSLDLAAVNIQRGRDHGLPDYNQWRKYCGLSFAQTFNDLRREIKSNKIRNKLKKLYGNPNNIDLWVGAVAEDVVKGSKVGPTFQCLLAEQFRRLRDGDRFYFENSGVFTSDQLEELKKSSLSRVICDNSDHIHNITADVFVQPKHQSWKRCPELPQIDLNKWHNSLMPTNVCHDQRINDFEVPIQLLNQLRNG